MKVFIIWFEKCFHKILEGDGLGVARFHVCQMLH